MCHLTSRWSIRGALHRSLKAFNLSFSRLSRFSNGTIYLALDQEDFVKLLIQELAQSFPDTPLYEGAFLDPLPHLTVAKAPNPRKAEEMEASITSALSSKLPLHAAVQAISVMVENQEGIWRVHYQHALNT